MPSPVKSNQVSAAVAPSPKREIENKITKNQEEVKGNAASNEKPQPPSQTVS